MTYKEKDENTKVLKKAHSITQISEPLQKAYTAEEVIKLIENDRTKVEVEYAHFLQRIL